MNEKKTVVLAADNNYAYQLITAFHSILCNVKHCEEYQFVFLLDADFEKENFDFIINLVNKFGVSDPVVFHMGDDYDKVEMQLKHITKATYFRLKLPDLLPNIEKCLYLDTDVIVCGDIEPLFDLKFDNYYLAGVKAAGFYYPEDKRRRLQQSLGVEKIDQYINAGVLLMNLQLMRKDNLSIKFEQLIAKNFKNQDQDILNAACYGKIKILEPKFNLMTKYKVLDENSYDKVEGLQQCYTRTEWNDACKNPIIIHYADKQKPWNDIASDYAPLWWRAAMKMGIIDQILDKNLDTLHDNSKHKIQLLNQKLQKTYDEKAERGIKIKTLEQEKAARGVKIKQLEQEKAARGIRIKELEREKETLRKNFNDLQKEINSVYNSRSYKLSRKMSALFRKVKNIKKK